MESIAYNNILVLVIQCVILASLLLTLFRMRTVFGLSLLFIALGVFQFLQVFLSSSLYIEIGFGISVSSGSVVLFTGSLFAVLLIYIRENALEARKVIYALLAANLVLALLLYVFSWMLEDKTVINIYNLPKEFYSQNANVVFIGTLILFIDSLAILLLYETISRYTKYLFFRILLTMVLVLGIDSLLFTLGIFYNSNQFQTILISGLIGKTFAAIIYTTLFSIYLFYIEKEVKKSGASVEKYSDIFNQLTFRQKFDKVSKEKEKIQSKLKSTENYLQTIFNATTDAIFIHDAATGQILDVNNGMCAMYGYTKKEVLEGNMPVLSSKISPYTFAEAKIRMEKAVTEGPQLFDWKGKHKDGHIFWVAVSLRLININGDDRIIATVSNIDERLKAQKVVVDKLNLNKVILETTLDGFILANENGKILNVNKAYSRLIGYTKKELLQMHISELEIKIPADQLKQRIDGFKKHGFSQFQTQHRCKNSEIVDLQVNLTAINLNGNYYMTAFVKNITQQKQDQANLKDLNNKLLRAGSIVKLGFIDWNFKTNTIELSPQAKAIYHMPDDEKDPIGFMNSHIHPDDLHLSSEGLENAIKGIKDYNVELRVILDDNSTIWVNARGQLVTENNGKVERFLGTIQDITERKQAEDNYKEAKSNLEALLDNRRDSIWSLDRDYNYIVFNKPYADVILNEHGIHIKKGMNALAIHPKEVGDFWKPKFDAVFHGELVTFDFSHAIEGEEHYFEVYLNPIYNDDVIIGLSALSMDVTDRKKNEIALKEQKQQMFSIYNRVNDIIFYISVEDNNQYRFVSINQAFSDSIGIAQNKVIGKLVSDIIPEPSLSLVLKKYKSAIDKKKSVTWEEVTPYPTGLKIGKVSITPIFNEKGTCTNIVGTVHDITQIRLNSNKLKELNKELEIIHNKELFLSKVSNCILERKGVKNIINAILKEAAEKVVASRISIVILDNESEMVEMYAEGILKDEFGNAKKLPLKEAFPVQDKLLKGEVIAIENIQQIKNPDITIVKLKEKGIQSILNIPIMSDNHLLGVLNFGFIKVETYQKFDMEFGKKLSNLIGIAINQEKLQSQIAKHTKSLENLILKRTKDLEEKNNLLKRTNKVFVGRELKMKALKTQIEQLKKQNKSNE